MSKQEFVEKTFKFLKEDEEIRNLFLQKGIQITILEPETLEVKEDESNLIENQQKIKKDSIEEHTDNENKTNLPAEENQKDATSNLARIEIRWKKAIENLLKSDKMPNREFAIKLKSADIKEYQENNNILILIFPPQFSFDKKQLEEKHKKQLDKVASVVVEKDVEVLLKIEGEERINTEEHLKEVFTGEIKK